MSCRDSEFPADKTSVSSPTEPEPQRLRIRTVPHLAVQLRTTSGRLLALAEKASDLYIEFERVVKGKRRLLVMAKPALAVIQRRILATILTRLPPFESSYGATKGRSIKDNALVHAHSRCIAKLDIRDFYRSIHRERIYRFFFEDHECAPDVARILTMLTTRKHSLPLGVATSPMLADMIIRGIDVRIYAMARKAGLRYTRYVDDITLSGDFSPEPLVTLVRRVLRQAGFRMKMSKYELYLPSDTNRERIITGVRVADGRTSAPLGYVACLRQELMQAAAESLREHPTDVFETRDHYRGKLTYVRWLDPKMGAALTRLYRKVKWRHLEWSMARGIAPEV